MPELIKFTATKLSSHGKMGAIPVDVDGYRTMIVGALNAFNSSGEYYVLDAAKKLFEESSTFMRRVRNGCLKGEVGHP
ncbi:MAG: S80 family phage morphogenetic serine protease, partial [Methylococcaceae bacterium]